MDSEKSKVLTDINQIVLESREDPNIEKWEKALIEDFADKVSKVLAEFESLEKEGEYIPDHNPFSSDLRKKFTKYFSSFLDIPSGFVTGLKLGYTSVQIFQNIWAIALNKVGETIESEQQRIGIENWGLSLGVGFPMGVSGTISVTFKNSS